MKIAYLINQYPRVSHSFIRREIHALERAEVSVARYSFRSSPDELVDQSDIEENAKTKFILDGTSSLKFIISCFSRLRSPLRFFKVLSLALSCGWRSERGVIYHFIYFLEACVISNWCTYDGVQHIHAHFGTNSTTVAMLAGKLAGIPYSFTVHGPEEFDKPVFISLGKKIELSSFVVAISSFGKSQLYRQLDGKYWNKVNAVHCGLDENFYSGEVESIHDSRNLVCVGRLCEQKGQLLLLEAANELVQDGFDFHLTLVGDGPMRKDVEDLIKKYSLESTVTITGWMSSQQVRKEIESSRALVLPSFAEGLPVVIMESMALCRPVITTYIAGIPELVKPKENGWLVPAGDIPSLVEAMESALEKPFEELVEMGLKARERVLERHNIDIEAAKLISLFEKSITDAKMTKEP